ncbi:MAG TPA: cytochrome C oxidase subunit IV [Flavobacteriales bacterium]|nr:cytochrome C oxidase subunit IV [Flavobacteriales bacterium]HIN39910.1 cytochrome C oxidase subunit IV [Flavobacteriales bacterium]
MERDDIIEYSLDAHHSEEEGKKIRKKIWFVTFLLTAITIFEVCLGVWWTSLGLNWEVVKYSFIIMTLIKAGYIVGVFMHLGDERKSFIKIVALPYITFICYLIFICLNEAMYWFNLRQIFGWLY